VRLPGDVTLLYPLFFHTIVVLAGCSYPPNSSLFFHLLLDCVVLSSSGPEDIPCMSHHEWAEWENILSCVYTDDSSSSAKVDPAMSHRAWFNRGGITLSATVDISIEVSSLHAPATRHRLFLLKHWWLTPSNTSVTHSGHGVLDATNTPISPSRALRGDTTQYRMTPGASSRSRSTDTSGETSPSTSTSVLGTGSKLTAFLKKLHFYVLSLRIANWDAKDSHFRWVEHVTFFLDILLLK